MPIFVKVRSGTGILSLLLFTIGQNRHRPAQREGEGKKTATLDEKDVYEFVALFHEPYHA